jgi:hypothetical protein
MESHKNHVPNHQPDEDDSDSLLQRFRKASIHHYFVYVRLFWVAISCRKSMKKPDVDSGRLQKSYCPGPIPLKPRSVCTGKRFLGRWLGISHGTFPVIYMG